MVFNPDNPNEHAQAQATQAPDPFDTASNAQPTRRVYYGQIDVNCWFCALVKGQGKVPYDPAQHERRSTCIDMQVIPLPEMNVSYELSRSMLDWDGAWARVAWPSLKTLGATSVRDIKGVYAKFEWAGTGRKYRASDGQERESTTFKFTALYESEEHCRKAFFAETGAEPGDIVPDVDDVPVPGFEPRDGNNGNGHALDAVKPFIATFAKMNGYDPIKTRELCRAQAMITAAIDVDSSEFLFIVAEAAQANGGN